MVFCIWCKTVFKKAEKLFMKVIFIIFLFYVWYVIAYDFMFMMREHPPLGFHIYAYSVTTIFLTFIWWIFYKEFKC